jgi:Carboxypeptidase regulatory-like domain/TonB dependent receptor
MTRQNGSGVISLVILVVAFMATGAPARAQSTATVQGAITDSQGAVMPGVSVAIRNAATGLERTVTTGSSGEYVAASLQPGHYEIVAHIEGFQDQKRDVDLDVAQIAVVSIKLGVATLSENVTVTGAAPLIDTATVSVGQVMAERTVQEIPLNGRHFVDLGPLMPGGVTAPQTAGLSAPLRGQGSFSFMSAGNRETSVNFMVNGINLNDVSNSQIVFQPSINTVSEFKVDNSTFSAEYGRNSGAIVNVATRSGANTVHGEAFDYYRNDKFDSRNYFNPPTIDQTTGQVAPKSPFNRKQFGVNLGGPIVKNRAFYFFSYEGLRHLQGVDLNSGTLTAAQRAAVTDPMSQRLLQYIPLPNATGPSGEGRLITSALAPVTINQTTIDLHHHVGRNDELHGYYAFQADLRTEPNAQGNTVPGFGDQRGGHRQIATVNETHVFSQALVNEARVGYNRLVIHFDPQVVVNPADLGISVGVTTPVALPQITIQGLNLNIGGPAGFPSGRTVSTLAAGDTATYLRGHHIIKFGGEFRRAEHVNFNLDPGTFSYASPAAFQTGLGNGFSITLGNRAYDLFINALGGFVQDSISAGPNVKLDLGVRYDFIHAPSEANNKLVVFDAASDSLVQVGAGINQIHKNTNDVEPRVGVIWNPTGDSRLAVRAAYAVMDNLQNTGVVTGSAANPPLSTPLNVSGAVRLDSAQATATASGLAPATTNPNYQQGRMQTWNVNVEREFGAVGLMVGYFGSYGDRLSIPININQFVNGVRPFAKLSASSPISPGATLGNITERDSTGYSRYKGLWITANHRMSHGLQLATSYTLSKSTDTNSYDGTGASTRGSLQNSYDLAGSYGLSDFDVRHRFSANVTYELPLHGNRLAEGWQLVGVVQAQSGSPFTVLTNINTFTGVSSLRPDLIGTPTIVGTANQWFANAVCDPRIAAPAAGSCSSASVFALPVTAGGVFHFGNLPRNSLLGPGFSDTDLSLIKNVRLAGQSRVQLRVEVFNVFNQANLGLPGNIATVGSTSLGLITATRFPTGDSGSARQVQFAVKYLF